MSVEPLTDCPVAIAENRLADRQRAVRLAALAESLAEEALALLFLVRAGETELARFRAAVGALHGARVLLGE